MHYGPRQPGQMSACRSGESKKNRQRACGSETGPRALARAPPLTSSSARPCRINSTPGRDRERHEPLSFSRRVSSDEPKPGSRFQRPASAGSAFTTGRPLSHRQHAPRPTTTRNSRRTSRHRYQHPKQTPAPSRIRNLANSAALVPPWLPNATSGLSGVIDSSCAGRRRRVTRPTARSRRLG